MRGLELDIGDYALGGGNALAARWLHRESVDSDFTIHEMVYQTVLDAYGMEGMKERLRKEGALNPEVFPHGISWKVPLRQESGDHEPRIGEASLSPEVPPKGLEPGEERESEHGVALERTAWILIKKLAERMSGAGKCYPRDAYDLVVCVERDPEALSLAMGSVGRERLQRSASRIRYELEIDPKWAGDGADDDRNRRIFRPHDRDLAENRLWREVATLLQEGAEAYIQRLAARRAPGKG